MTTIFVLIVYRVRRLRASRKARNYSEHYLRRTTMAMKMGGGSQRAIIDGSVGVDDDTFATGAGEQKCIRDEVVKRRLLKTFSPVRKEFYVSSTSDLHGGGGGSLMRTIHGEPLYQQGLNHHDVLHYNHPYVGQNFGTSNSPQVTLSSSSRNNIQNHNQNHYQDHRQITKEQQQQHHTVQNLGSSEYNNNHTSPYHHRPSQSSTLPSPSASYQYHQQHHHNQYGSRSEMIGPASKQHLVDNNGTMLSKCSHGSRYQVPFMVRHDSKKSSLSSQQSSFFNSSLTTE